MNEREFLTVNGIVWWDETHRDTSLGDAAALTHNYYLSFKRDANGTLSETGEYNAGEKSVMKVKYEKQVRLCLGCAMVKKIERDGTTVEEGKRCKPYYYSEKVMLSIKDYDARVENEIKRVKALKDGKDWIEDPRNEGELFRNNSVTRLPGIGKHRAQLLSQGGVTLIGQLKHLSDNEIIRISNKVSLSTELLDGFRSKAQSCKEADAPQVIDHRKANNPYKSYYRERPENWTDVIAKASSMSGYVCVTSMIKHIHDESKALMEGTVHEDDWYFYHDALALMTAKDTRNWMETQGYLKRWVLPINDLNKSNPKLKRYVGRPVGNSPEFMPWDNNLNKDVHDAVQWHCLLTDKLDKKNGRKFSLATPALGTHAYVRVLEGCPSNKRICQDVKTVVQNLEIVFRHKNRAVPGLAKRSGKRYLSATADYHLDDDLISHHGEARESKHLMIKFVPSLAGGCTLMQRKVYKLS